MEQQPLFHFSFDCPELILGGCAMHRVSRTMSATAQFQFTKHSASSVSAGLAIVQTSF